MKDTADLDWNPFSYAADVKANPDAYVSTTSLMTLAQARIQLKNAPTLESLKKLWIHALKDFPDGWDRKWLAIEKDRRKAVLEG